MKWWGVVFDWWMSGYSMGIICISGSFVCIFPFGVFCQFSLVMWGLFWNISLALVSMSVWYWLGCVLCRSLMAAVMTTMSPGER